MNRNRIEGTWKQVSGKVRELWCALLGDAPGVRAARHMRLGGGIQARRGVSQDLSERQFREFLQRNHDWNPSSHRPLTAPDATQRITSNSLYRLGCAMPHRPDTQRAAY